MSVAAETIKEHDVVVLTRDVPEHGLVAGDSGVVVSMHAAKSAAEPAWYALEIFALNGDTIDVIDVPAGAVRPARKDEIAHARPVAAE